MLAHACLLATCSHAGQTITERHYVRTLELNSRCCKKEVIFKFASVKTALDKQVNGKTGNYAIIIGCSDVVKPWSSNDQV